MIRPASKLGLVPSTMFLLLVTGCTMATKVHQLPLSEYGVVSSEILNQPVPDTTLYLAKYAGEDGVILSLKETIEHSGSKSRMFRTDFDWSFSYQHQRRYMIINPEATDLATVTLDHRPSKFYAVVTSPSGLKKVYSGKDLIAFKVTDKDTDYRLTFAGVERGSVVSYGFENTQSTFGYVPMEYSHWVQYRMPVESLTISFNYPNWWQILVQETGNRVKEMTQTIPHPEFNKLELRYEGRMIPAYRTEPFSPPEFWQRPRLEYELTNAETTDEWQRPKSWNDLFQNLKSYTHVKGPEADRTIALLADSLLGGATNLTQTSARVVEFVRHQIGESDKSYNGKSEAVVHDRKGDSFDKLALAMRLFQEVHLTPALYALTSFYNGPFDQGYLNYDQFAGYAIQVSDAKDTLLVFPTARNIPVNLIPYWYRGQPALKVEEAYIEKFWSIPSRMSLTEPETIRDIHVDIDSATGNASVTEKTTYLGDQAYYMRNAVLPTSGSKRVDSLRRFVGFYGADIRDYTTNIVNDSFYDLPLEIEYHYTVANLLANTPEEKVFQTGDLFNPALSFVSSGRPDTLNRVQPFWVHSPTFTKRNITINYPPSWKLVTPIPPEEFANDVGSVSTISHELDGQISLEQSARLNQVRLPKERLTDLYALIQAGEKGAVSSLVFSRKEK